MPNSELVHSVLKALDILRLAAESRQGIRLADISAELNLKTTTAHNIVRTLRARGYLAKDAQGGYVLGPAPEELLQSMRRRTIFQRGGALLQTLARRYPQAVLTLSELTSGGICCRLRISPDRPGELQHPWDRFFPPYSSLTGRCLLALSPDAEAFEEEFSFEEYGARYYPDFSAFLAERMAIRKQGYCCQRRGENTAGAAFFIPDRYAVGISRVEQNTVSFPDIAAKIRHFIEQTHQQGEE